MLKQFLRDWLITPRMLKLVRKRRLPRIQKFWNGEPLDAPPHERSYFAAAGMDAITLTRLDDSRSAGKLPRDGSTLGLPAMGGDLAQLAFAVDQWDSGDRLQISAGGRSTTHTHLSPHDWLDVRVGIPADQAAEVKVQCTRPVHVTMPRRVRSRPQGDYSRHVLVLVLDGMTPYLKPDPADTPNIERFFAEGFRASNGWSTGEWTLPTTGSFFTSLYTSRHGMWHPTMPTRQPERPTLSTIFQDAGYHNLALSTANRFTPAYGSHRGFDRFIYHWAQPGWTSRDYDPARWCDEILGHLDTHRHDRTFVYAHFPDTHPCWNVPPLTRAFNLQRRGDSTGHDLDALRDHTDGAAQGLQLNTIRLHDLDRLLAGVFDFVERYMAERTHIVLTADHGTPWAALRAQRPADEPYLVDHRTHVEMRLRGPGVPRRHYDRLCSPTIDLMPTLLKLSGLGAPADLDGRDLLDSKYHRDCVISESLYDARYEIAVRDASRTYVEKFPLREGAGTIGGDRVYSRCFARGAEDYASPLATDCSDLAAAALQHRRSVGMLE